MPKYAINLRLKQDPTCVRLYQQECDGPLTAITTSLKEAEQWGYKQRELEVLDLHLIEEPA